ncbi:MAG: adenosylcobinamide-GDP ribazoletransferase [Chitinispirillaceae bacterium]|nr:adenosylcobinamide-GDP ribazoletransferase [Chitinispirillaceae bacterium]
MIAPLVTAVRTLTIIPMPGSDAKDPSAALPYFPIIGAAIGVICYLTARGSSCLFGDYPFFGGLLVTVVSIVITGALHLDGLADVADGFGSGGTKERILEIFKDSRHGTFGVTAIVFDLIARVLFIAWCCEKEHLTLILISPFFSRTVMAWGCALLPSARSGGGTAVPFISNKPPIALFLITVGLVGVIVLAFGCIPLGTILLISFVPVQLFYFYCLKKIDGITGDCLGAVNEIGELTLLLTGCIGYGFISASGG